MFRKKNFRRLILILSVSALFALPLVIIVYQAVFELNQHIRIAQKEESGMRYHTELVDLQQRLQELYGLSYRAMRGDETVSVELATKKQETGRMIALVNDLNSKLGKDLGVYDTWLTVKARCLLMLEPLDMQHAAETFKRDTGVIEALRDLMMNIADNSALTLDPQLDTDYLADAMVNVTPDLMQTIGKLRGLTSGLLVSGKAPSNWTPQEIRQLQALYDRLLIQDEDIRNSLERAASTNKQSALFAGYHDSIVKPRLTELQHHFEQMIYNQAAELGPTPLFRMATDAIIAYDMLYDKISDAFLVLLKEREENYILKKNLVLYSSIIASLGFLLLFTFLYRNLARTEHNERALALRRSELLVAKTQAESASIAKSDFLANMSHELRTPLNSILGMTRMLSESNLPKEQHELADTVFRSSVNLLDIVNDILDLSKIEAGEMRLEHIGFDPGYVLHSVVDAISHIAKEKRLLVIPHYELEKFPYLLGDPTRLNHILINLIGNAIKYTDKGQVEIYGSCQPIGDARVEFRCDIKDTGIGIAADKQQTIFEKFVQADSSTTRRYGGTGLGLAITKQLVELMGGRIGVDSIAGEGSIFWFTIPFEVTDKLNEDKHIRRQKTFCGTVPANQARLLLAEDHPMNQLFMQKILRKFGINHVTTVGNGQQALAAYREQAWDVILMDCHMPEKNGYETTKDIRHLEKTTGAHVPIVAMTANAMVGDKEKCLRYGMDEYLSKPVNLDELKDVLSQWLLFSEIPAAPAPKIADSPIPLDLTQLHAFSEGDKTAEKALIDAFITQSDHNIDTLQKAFAAHYLQTWSETAHMLKGGSSGIGATTLSHLSQQAQYFTGTDAQRQTLLEDIMNEYAKVKAHLIKASLLE